MLKVAVSNREASDGLVAEKLGVLRELALFADLPEEPLQRIAEAGEIVEAAAETVLFEEGGPADELFILLRGQVSLIGRSPDGSSTIVEVLRPVDQFQLAAALMEARHLVTARILTAARLFRIPAQFLRGLIAAEPRLALLMLASVAQHYRMLVHQVKDLKLRSAAQRLGCFILALSREQGYPQRIKLPFDKQLVAARLGTTPENLSRAFATLRNHGVTTSGSIVVVTDPMRLAAFSAPDEIS